MAYSGGEKTQQAPWGGGMGDRPAFTAKAEAATVPTPDGRTITVGASSRVVAVSAASRTITVDSP